jgi:hypothetical protein
MKPRHVGAEFIRHVIVTITMWRFSDEKRYV